MDKHAWLAERFEEHQTRLRAVAYRMLGSLAEADEVVQDAWLRVSRLGAGEIDMGGSCEALETLVLEPSCSRLRGR
jgi:Sigma-70 region 2